jgi:hypothetical protein
MSRSYTPFSPQEPSWRVVDSFSFSFLLVPYRLLFPSNLIHKILFDIYSKVFILLKFHKSDHSSKGVLPSVETN